MQAAGERDTKRGLKNRFPDSEYDLSRFRPLLKTVLEDMFASKLDTSIFPYIQDPTGPTSPTAKAATSAPPAATSLRNKPMWTKGGNKAAGVGAQRADNRQRVFVFVAGGMTYSEMRSAYELSRELGKDIYIGSTHTITPEEFIGDLQTLDIGGQGSATLPGGLPEGSSTAQPPPFQWYYDQKYMTKDEPPPAPKASQNTFAPSDGRNGLPSRPGLSPVASHASSSGSPSPGPGAVGEGEKKHDKLKKKRFLGF